MVGMMEQKLLSKGALQLPVAQPPARLWRPKTKDRVWAVGVDFSQSCCLFSPGLPSTKASIEQELPIHLPRVAADAGSISRPGQVPHSNVTHVTNKASIAVQ